jgi:dTDP-4-dehydrorhamnose 3,5-epimerase
MGAARLRPRLPGALGHRRLSLQDDGLLRARARAHFAWNDPAIGIEWPLETEPVLSAKDKVGTALEAEVFA